MVTDTMPDATDQVDQVLQEQETPTEDAPQLSLDAVAAEQAAGEAAAPEGEPATPAPDPVAELRAEMERMKAELAKAERERRNRQREGAIKAQQEQQRALERRELEDTVAVVLGKAGVLEPDPDTVRTIIDRVAGRDAQHVRTSTLGDVANAFTAAAAEVLGADYDGELSPTAESYRQNFEPFVKDMYERAKQAALESGDYIPKADLPKLVEAEIQRRNAVARQGKEPLKRVEGATPSTIDRSLEAVTNRIIANDADDKDREIWNARFRS